MTEPREKLALGRVTGELDGDRGADVRSKVTIPEAWFEEGADLLVTRPRLANCERCRGGGCAICDYQGALTLTKGDDAPTVVPVQLPRGQVGPVTVRLPHLGFRRDIDAASGHWLLEVHAGPTCGAGVTRVAASGQRLWAQWWLLGLLVVVVLIAWLVAR